MSFGFSVGDFLACGRLIRDISQALASSTGSASEFKALLETLSSFDRVLVNFKVIYNQPAISHDASFENLILEAIGSECQKCQKILEAFHQSIKPYTKSFSMGKGKSITRHFRKITWLSHKDDVTAFERKLDGHMKTLSLWIGLYNAAVAGKNALNLERHSANILSSIANHGTNIISVITNRLEERPVIPSSLGYNWDSGQAVKDNILLFDPIGRNIQLPMILVRSEHVFHETVLIMYGSKHIPGRRKIRKKEYTLTDEDASEAGIIEESNWLTAIRPGMKLSLNIMMTASSGMDFQRCPLCSESSLGSLLSGQRRRCHACQHIYWVSDKERIKEETNPTTPSDPESDSDSDQSDQPKNKNFANPKRTLSGLHDENKKRKTDGMRKREKEFSYKRVHYQRELWVTKKAQTNIATNEIQQSKETEVLDIDKLPALHKAAVNGSIVDIDCLLDTGYNIDEGLDFDARIVSVNKAYYDVKGATALHLACWYGEIKSIRRLLDRGANIRAKDADDAEAIHFAIAGRSPDRVFTLLSRRGANLSCKDKGGNSPFHEACVAGCVHIVHSFLDDGVDIEEVDEKGRTPIIHAIWNASQPVFEMLLEQNASLTAIDSEDHQNALHFASIGGSTFITGYLLDKGFDPSIVDVNGNTALRLAAVNGFTEIVNLLLKHGANFTIASIWGSTPLHGACREGHSSVIKSLLRAGASPITPDEDDDTPLHEACWNGHISVVDLLLETQAVDVSVVSKTGSTALHYACYQGNVYLAQTLLKQNKKIISAIDEYGNTPFHEACSKGHISVVELLLETKAIDVSTVNKDGDTALHYACYSGHIAVVKILLEQNNSLISATNKYGNTPFHEACSKGHISVVELLLETKAIDVSTANKEGETALHYASYKGHIAIVRIILEQNNSLISATDKHGDTPIHDASAEGHLSIVELLLYQQNLEAVLAKNETEKTALHEACWYGHLSIAQLLFNNGKEAATIQDKHGNTPLHLSSYQGHTSIVEFLLEAETCPFLTQNDQGETPLHLACRQGHLDIATLLVESDDKACFTKQTHGEIPLHTSCAHGHVAIVQILLQKWKDGISSQNNFGNTPLHRACAFGHVSVVKLLLNQGADVSCINKYGSLPVHIASERGHTGVVQILLENNSGHISAQDNFGDTPLHKACIKGHESVVELLLAKGADVLCKNTKDMLPIHFASDAGHTSIIQLLLEKCSESIIAQDIVGNTPLQLACISGNESLVMLLIDRGADISCKNNFGWQPIHHASYHGHLAIIRLLIKRSRSVILAQTTIGDTALNRACLRGHESTAEFLLAEGADIAWTNNLGRQGIHDASSEGHLPIVKLLLDKFADGKFARSNMGNTPLSLACYYGHESVAAFLIEQDSDICSINEAGEQPIHAAAKSGGQGIIELLVAAGADVNVRNNDGWTALQCASLLKKGSEKICRLLVELGAELSDEDRNGWAADNKLLLSIVDGDLLESTPEDE